MGSTPFTPKDLPGIAAWFDAGNAGGVDGANLATWPDISGHAFDLNAQDAVNVFHASGGANGTAYVAFSLGSIYRLAPLVTGADAARTMFIVSKRGADDGIYVLDGRNGFNGFAYSIGVIASNKREVLLSGVAGELDTTSNATNNWEQVCLINTNTGGSVGAQRLRVGGVEHTLSASNGTPAASTTSFSVGGAHPAGHSLTGDIAEVIVCGGVLSASDITKTEAYLLAKYGV